ncbi:HNH endonuclease [Candidatus Poribacteria bacterium]|nr:HNH endonuclease [Candidatus Poribacteria bacterium]
MTDNKIIQKYIQELTDLNIDKASGIAPHQPILLLSIIELIEQGKVSENKINPSAELYETFIRYWSIITDREPNLAMPFFHLKKKGFWHHQANPEFEKALQVTTQIKTVTRLREIIAYGYFNDDLFDILKQPESRELIRQSLIEKYFADRKQEIAELIIEEYKIGEYSQKILEQVRNAFSAGEKFIPFKTNKSVRKAAFRRAIMSIYDYTCVVCRLHIMTLDNVSVTEAAHIIPFSVSGNDDVRNGISLCHLHHWTFDKGLISLNNDYTVIVSDLLVERGPDPLLLKSLIGSHILLPRKHEEYPAQEAMEYHREKVFNK